MENFIYEVSKEDYDIDYFLQEIQKDELLKVEIIENLLGNKDIMVYYHCYEILDKATLENPDNFYKYWNDFYSLLSHENSYHRDIGLTLIGNIISVDKENLFKGISNEYFSHIEDENFKVVNSCLKNINRICKYKKEYIEDITKVYLNIDNIWKFNEKQRELLKFYIIRFFETFYNDIEEKDTVVEYVKNLSSSISPKTRRRAKSSKLKKYYK